MKKIAILTTHRANNFGAMLQAYALVTAIRAMGADAEILDWRCKHFEWSYHYAWRIYRNPIPAFKRMLFYYGIEWPVRRRFKSFRARLPMSPVLKRKQDLIDVQTSYDLFIAGSDQIWNPINSSINRIHFDRTYFLDFVADKKKKKAYAASIGVQRIEPKSIIPEYQRLLAGFSSITVRESSGADLVEELIHERPEVVLDPVLLHTKEFWQGVFGDELYMSNEPYLLLYNIKKSDVLRSEAIAYAKIQGLRTVEVVVPAQPSIKNTNVDAYLQAGPAEFLRLLANAAVIFTNSFHASAFSVLFHKALYVETADLVGNSNSRIETLFMTSGLEQYISVQMQNGKNTIRSYGSVDWHQVDGRMEIARAKSLQILGDLIR